MADAAFWVDWEDPSFPHIRTKDDPGYDEVQELITITEAKQGIIEHFTVLRDHARDQIAAVRKVRGDELEPRTMDELFGR